MAYAYIYKCPIHGETINVYIYESIDVERDDIELIPMCKECNQKVMPILNKHGMHIMRSLSDEELIMESRRN